jgi:hypothetical protein
MFVLPNTAKKTKADLLLLRGDCVNKRLSGLVLVATVVPFGNNLTKPHEILHLHKKII